MPRARDLDPGASLLAFFGAELRRARLAAGLSMDELGRDIHYSGAQVGRVENGDRLASLQFVRRCDVRLKTDGRFERLWEQVRKYSHSLPSGFDQFLEYMSRGVRPRV
jgi:transcriptional regulator with XRE-family HTH domain